MEDKKNQNCSKEGTSNISHENTQAPVPYQKPNKEPTKAQRDNGTSRWIEAKEIIINMHPATRPSRPSIKLIKLITATAAINNKRRNNI